MLGTIDHETKLPSDPRAEMTKKRDRLAVMQDLTKDLPKNEFGLPQFIYRPDLITDDFDDLSIQECQDVLKNATIDIQYREGFPALDDGTPIWGPLPYESEREYQVFEKYLALADTEGVRRIDLLVADVQNLSRSTLIQYYTYYYWSLRSRALDLFQIAAAQKMRERRILSTNDRHFLEAEKILGQVLTYFHQKDDDGNPKFLAELTPKTAMDMLDKLSKMQRVALGLPAHGHSGQEIEGDTPKNAGFEMVLRTIAKKSGDVAQASSRSVVDMLLSDPDAAMMAQELILKVNSEGKERTITAITDSPTSIADEVR